MTGFEPGSSRIVSDRSANCATTTSHIPALLPFDLVLLYTQPILNNIAARNPTNGFKLFYAIL